MAYVITQLLVSGMANKGLTTTSNIDDELIGKTQQLINHENRRVILSETEYASLTPEDGVLYFVYESDDGDWGFDGTFDITFG